MTSREKILAWIVATAGLACVGLFGARFLLITPLRQIDTKTATLLGQLQKARETRQAYFKNEEILKKLTRRTFSDDPNLASAKSGAMLTREILRCGLSESSFTRLPVGPRKLRGAQELGWSIQGSGPLDKIVNLLYALENSPYLHRIDNLTLNPESNRETVRARFSFLTLVIQPAPEVTFEELTQLADLQSPQRQHYDLIVQRNLLQPYQPPPPTPPPPAPEPPPEPPPTGPGPETFRIVSLSEWLGEPEIHVRDLTENKTLHYKPGQSLAGGTVIMVDYRPLPFPGRDGLKSFSRVIIQIGSDFWAIEKGQTLADKYQLTTEQLPPSLKGG